MFQIGDKVIYGNDGVCLVEAVGPLPLDGCHRKKAYYTMSPLYGSGRIYAPVETSVFMRPILTREEAEALIRGIPRIQGEAF